MEMLGLIIAISFGIVGAVFMLYAMWVVAHLVFFAGIAARSLKNEIKASDASALAAQTALKSDIGSAHSLS